MARGGRVRSSISALTFAALVGALLPAAAPAVAQSAPGECATVMPLSEVRTGQTGTGWTVVTGRTPRSFTVRVLGVLENGILPGRDMIIVDTSGSTVDAGGGIWSGMSGSPVYIGGRLVGAVAFGLSAGPNSIGGLTPAQDMLEVADLGTSTDAVTSLAATDEVRLDAATRRTIAAHAGVSVSQVGTLRRLPVPLSMSGLGAGRLEQLSDAAAQAGVRLTPFAGSAVGAPVRAQATDLDPGDNFAAALSYGDVTAAGIGTTTYVCDDVALAFGHPFFFRGSASFGANAADAITIVDDPLFAGFKLANVAEALGTVDQDRMAAIRADLGTTPALTPITSTITALDTGRERDGRTDVTDPDELPFIALSHTLGNLDSTFDAIAEGSSELSFTATGTRAGGGRFTLRRDNRFASEFDISFESIMELLTYLDGIARNAFEDVTFTSLDVDAEVEETRKAYAIKRVDVIVDGVSYDGAEVPVAPGSQLELHVTVNDVNTRRETVLALLLEVPGDIPANGGTLTVSGGPTGGDGDPFQCLFNPESCGQLPEPIESFDDLVEALEGRARNDDLVVSLRLNSAFGGTPVPGVEEPAVGVGFGAATWKPGQSGPVTVDLEPTQFPSVVDEPATPASDQVFLEARVRLDRVVSGVKQFAIPPTFPGPTITRLAGGDRIGTAVALSQAQHPAGLPGGTVVIARADDPADALTAAPLAASVGGPVLLSERGRLSAATAEEVARLGATTALVLGGEGALAKPVADGLAGVGVTRVERLAGANRFDTARRVAERVGGTSVVLVGAAVDAWPDAVAASGAAAFARRPILLTAADRLAPETAAALFALGATEATVVGGRAAVGDPVTAELERLDIGVRRVSGNGRYGTSAAAANLSLELGADPNSITIATGRAFPDGLAAGAYAGSGGGVLLLVDGQDLGRSPETRDWLAGFAGLPTRVTLVGGEAAISTATEFAIAELLLGGAPFPGLPEPSPPPAG